MPSVYNHDRQTYDYYDDEAYNYHYGSRGNNHIHGTANLHDDCTVHDDNNGGFYFHHDAFGEHQHYIGSPAGPGVSEDRV